MNKVGATASYIQFKSAAFNIVTGEEEEGSPTTTSVKIIPPYKNNGFNLSGAIKATQFFAPEALLTGVKGDALTTPPAIGDEITQGGKRWKVVEIEPIRSGDDIALYMLRIDEQRGV